MSRKADIPFDVRDGAVTVLLPNDQSATLTEAGVSSQGESLAERRDTDDAIIETSQLPNG
jgi:hypothetical protein